MPIDFDNTLKGIEPKMKSTDHSKRHVAFITGASRGIGAATAIALAGHGVDVAVAVRNPASADEVRRTIEAEGGSCLVVACDVARLDTVKTAIQQTIDRFGRIDTVVNNAGQVEPIARIGDGDPAAWAQAMGSNLIGPYHVVHTALQHLQASRGAVINISTGAALIPREGWSAYCSSKAGLLMFTRAIAHEYASEGLFAFGLQPGLVDTAMQSSIRKSGVNEISRLPRSDLAPVDLPAKVIAWLALHRPADLNGTEIRAQDESTLRRIDESVVSPSSSTFAAS